MDSRNVRMIIPAIYSDVEMILKDMLMAEVDGEEENNVVFTTSGLIVK